MTFTGLLTNVRAMAEQAAGRVRTLRDGFCLIGSAGESWDEQRQIPRLATAEEFLQKVLKGVGPGRQFAGYQTRRYFTQTEARQLVKFSRHMARVVRRNHPDLC